MTSDIRQASGFARAVKPVARALVNLLFRVKTSGFRKDLLHNPRTMVVANHASFLDGLVLGLNLPSDATFVINTAIAKQPAVRWMLKLVDYITLDPTAPMAMKMVVRLLESGRPVVIFPEGRLTTTGSLMKVYEGAGFAATRAQAVVQPIRLTGTDQTYLTRLKGLIPRSVLPRITLTAVPAQTLAPAPEDMKAKERRKHAGEQLRHVMTRMLVQAEPDRTLGQAFFDAKSLYGGTGPLLEDIRATGLQSETYASLHRMVLMMKRLTSRVSAPGENVGVLMPNATATVALMLGLSMGRRVPAMLNYTAGRDGLQAACTAAQIKTVITSRMFIEKAQLQGVIDQLQGLNLVFAEDLRESIGLGDKLAVLLQSKLGRRVLDKAQSAADAAVILFTSGSEGRPKGVVHSHRSLLSNIAQIRAVADFTPQDKFMVALPLFHSFGLTCGALMPVVSGCRAFYYPSPLHYRVIPEVVYDRNCTVLFGTSTFLGNYARFAHAYDFARLRYVVAGAEKLNETVRETWMDRFGVRIMEGYGATECAPVLAVNTPMAYRKGTVGQLVPTMDYRLEPIPGIERGGLLHVKGPNIMSGYLKVDKPGVLEKPESSEGEGWYCTGDIVTLDAQGFVSIQGRVKRFAKLAGEMVSLESVEGLANACLTDGKQAAVSTRPDASKGEALVLFTTDTALTRDKLLQSAREKGLPELNVPRFIKVVDALPLLGTGKTDYVTLKNWAAV